MSPSPVIGNARVFVHFLAHAVAFQLTDNGKTKTFRIRLHRVSDIAGAIACNRRFYPFVQRCLGDIQEPAGFGVHLPDREGVGRIAVVSFVQGSAIHGDDVTLFQGAVGRKTVYHDIVHAHAKRCREAVKTFEGGNGAMITDKGLGHLVQLRSCHTRGDQLTDLCQRLGHQLSIDAEQFDFFFGLGPEHIVKVLPTFKTYMPERPVRRPVFMSPS